MRRGIWYGMLVGALAAALVGFAQGARAGAGADPMPLTEPPIRWVPPATFDVNLPGRGFPQAPGCENTIIYDPAPCRGNVDEGGNGKYEDVLHGTFNHHPGWYFLGDYVITQWTNHSRDENGPGQRELCRVGKWVGDKNSPDAEIDWGDPAVTTVEVAPPPILIRRRTWSVSPDTIYPYITGGLTLRGDTLYLVAYLDCIGGYTTSEANRNPMGPLPAAEYSDSLNRAAGFRYDMWFNLGMQFVQRWRLQDDRLVPDSPLYQITPQVKRVEVTPGRSKVVAPLVPPYTNMIPIAQAPADIRRAFTPRPAPPQSTAQAEHPQFKDGAYWLAADGKDGLAHFTEYRRPDGKYVSIRDNLLNAGHYYASIREPNGYYPPAMETNLYGGASPSAGTLPDGRIYLLCNSQRRLDMFMMLSRDGIVFDRTWLLVHSDREFDGGIYKGGGPQYYHANIIGPNMWIFYSIGKVQMGVTKVLLATLE